MKTYLTLAAAAILTASCCTAPKTEYKAEWNSLSQHNTPQWFQDMKFGIYSHWGPQSVLASEGRAKDGVKADNAEEIYSRWKGENFNAKEWVAMMKDAGAEFGGPVVIHGTGCVNWDSEVTSWNSVNYGPKIDILGELSRELRKADMKVLATFHNINPKGIWGEKSLKDRTFIAPNDDLTQKRIDQSWLEGWYDRVIEAVTKYDVDIAWFDTSFGETVGGDLNGYLNDGHFNPDIEITNKRKKKQIGGLHESIQQRFIADFFNYAKSNGREVEVLYKTHDIPANIGMRDIENGSLNGLQYDPWISDVNMMHHVNSWTWFYAESNPLKDANCLIDMLIDMTSKNGRLLLNVPPKPDGTFAPKVVAELKAMGEWLRLYGEGIYGSTPWCVYGEGPTFIKNPGHHGQGKNKGKEMAAFTSEDLRYTTKGRDIYAFVLDKPADGVVEFRALGSENKLYPGEIKGVSMVGSTESIKWEHLDDRLVVTMPSNTPQSFAYSFKIER